MSADTSQATFRGSFVGTLEDCLRDVERSKPGIGLLAIDLENFDRIASAYGARTAEAVIADFLSALESSVRPRDAVRRIGDARFAVIVTQVRDANILTLAAAKIGRLGRTPRQIGTDMVALRLRIGITIAPGHGNDAESLLRNAEAALIEAAAQEADSVFFAAEQLQRATDSLRLETELDAALKRREFEFHFQPKIATADFSCCGAEALIRWRSPTRGLVPPDLFIDLLDRPGRMESLTTQLLNSALVQASAWPRAMSVSINLSPRMLLTPELEDMVGNALKLWDFDPNRLVIEITEGAIMADPAASFLALSRLRELGIGISIDDFGTGYSSFAYFKNIPADELKIDKSFVSNMLTDDGDRKIVRAIVQLSKEFGLSVTAEGVEDAATARMLAGLGCDRLQGYHYSRPLSQSELLAWLAARTARTCDDSRMPAVGAE